MESVIEARRAKFEAAYQAKYEGMPLGWSDEAGAYLYGHANAAWFGYNAALDSLVIELPNIGDYLDLYRQGEDADAYLHDLFQSVEKEGVKVK
jgi:hypothetical protein